MLVFGLVMYIMGRRPRRSGGEPRGADRAAAGQAARVTRLQAANAASMPAQMLEDKSRSAPGMHDCAPAFCDEIGISL